MDLASSWTLCWVRNPLSHHRTSPRFCLLKSDGSWGPKGSGELQRLRETLLSVPPLFCRLTSGALGHPVHVQGPLLRDRV